MAHIEKYNKAAVGHLLAHYDRQAENIGNENVDRSRSYLNYNLAAELQPMRQGDFIKQRCSEVKMQKRKDVNVMCTWVVTAPQDLPETEQAAFFKATFDFLAARYGKENVISSYVHLDETTPHIHFAFVPVVEDRKKGGFKVSAKERVDRSDLRSFHLDLDKAISVALGHSVGILNAATKDGNKTISELKQKTAAKATAVAEQQERKAIARTQYAKSVEQSATERIQNATDKMRKAEIAAAAAEHDAAICNKSAYEANQKAKAANLERQAAEQRAKNAEQLAAKAEQKAKEHDNARKMLKAEKNSLQTELSISEKRLKTLQEEINAAEKRLEKLQGEILTQEEVNAINGKKTLTGGLKGVTYEEYLSLKRTAQKIEYYNNAYERLRQKEKETDKRLQETENLIQLRLSEIDQLTKMAESLITSNDIAKKLKQAEKEKGLLSREIIKKNTEIIRKKQEERLPEQNQKPKNHNIHR